MEQQVHVDYISFPEKNEYIHDWSRPHSFSGNWEMPTSPTNSMPIWQYTTAALSRVDAGPSSPYFVNSHDSPISPGPSSSTLPSPIVPSGFQHNQQPKYTPLPHNYEFPARAVDGYSASEQTVPAQPMQFGEANSVTSPEEEEEDSDTYNMWEPSRTYNSTSKSTTGPIRPSHRRTQSTSVTEMSSRNAKRAHTVVERNYRERLNDKIADLAQYLFETSSDSRTKPSKSLVMTRAKERLKQLESRNTNLENEVTKLRQHIAILEHIVASSQGLERTTAPLVTS